jgi:protocatechuate 3,4-dioxygenase beta subunit
LVSPDVAELFCLLHTLQVKIKISDKTRVIFNWIVRQNSVNIINIKPQRNTGISLTAPVFFNGTDWKAPQPLISNIYCRIFDNEGQPLKNTLGEVWNIDERVAKITTDEIAIRT